MQHRPKQPRTVPSSPRSPYGRGRLSGKFYAALDLGTNNCRLMIAREEEESIKVVDSFSQIVKLGEGVSRDQELSKGAMERTIRALGICANKLDQYPITAKWFVTTEACRRARNGAEFIKRVKAETGLQLQVITHKDEAVLAFLGCSPLLYSETDIAIMLDIGGGSTEMILVDVHNPLTPHVIGWESFPYGVMNVTERYGKQLWTEEGFDTVVQELLEPIRAFAGKHGLNDLAQDNQLQMLSSSGTSTTVGALQQGLHLYDRNRIDGMVLYHKDVTKVSESLLEMGDQKRRQHSCIGEERADFILAGCAILQAICNTIPTDALTVADRGLREGIILSLYQKYQ